MTWTVLYRVLYTTSPKTLGLASVGLAALYLVAGLAALQRVGRDVRQARVLLGLAAAFLTLAIPVQLGLHGITLAWAVEGSSFSRSACGSSPRSRAWAATACWGWPLSGSSRATCRCTRAVPIPSSTRSSAPGWS